MSEENTQAVVDAADTTAQPVVQANDARTDGDSLESLLAQFDQGTKTEPVSPPVKQPEQTAPAVDPGRLHRIEERLFKEDLDKAVANITGDMKVPKRVATGWLDQMAREDPRIGQAFLNKEANPSAWSRIERTLAKEFSKEMKQFTSIDHQVTEDREIVAAAVRGASTAAPEEKAPDFAKMTDGEMRKWFSDNGLPAPF